MSLPSFNTSFHENLLGIALATCAYSAFGIIPNYTNGSGSILGLYLENPLFGAGVYVIYFVFASLIYLSLSVISLSYFSISVTILSNLNELVSLNSFHIFLSLFGNYVKNSC